MQKTRKKINLEFINERFDVDHDNKKIKCTLTFNPHIKDFAELYGRPSDAILDEAPRKFAALKEALNNDTFKVVGVSICAKEDDYDPKTGMEIARQRARYKAEKKYNRWLMKYLIFSCMYVLEGLRKPLEHSCKAIELYKETEKQFLK